MKARPIAERVGMVAGCLLLSFLLASCAVYRSRGRFSDVAHGQFAEGDRIRVHLLDGRRIDDRFVRINADTLECESERVNLDELCAQMDASGRTDVERMQMKEPEGIGGWNPLKYASADLGQEIVAFCAARIGQKALDVLEGRLVPPAEADPGFLDNPGPTD